MDKNQDWRANYGPRCDKWYRLKARCLEHVVFGSISGYIGFYNIVRSDLKYI